MKMKIQDVISHVTETVPLRFYPNEFPKGDTDNCGFIRLEEGSPPDIYIVGLTTPSIQIVVRHEKGSEAERLSNKIWNLFHGKEHYKIGSSKVFFSSCNQSEPVFVGKDENGRTIYSINVTCKVIE